MRTPLSTLAPARRRLVLVLAAVLAVALVIVVVALVSTGSEEEKTVDPARPGPVIVLPGYGGDTEPLTPLLAALRGEGREVVLFEPTDNEQGDLRVQAKRLAALADSAADGSDAGSVDVIGYSAGGVIARLFVRDYDGADVVRRVLTLGSPHHGAEVAGSAGELAGGCPKACEQLAIDSDLLRELNAGDETPAGPRWVDDPLGLRPDGDSHRLRQARRCAQHPHPGPLPRQDHLARRSARRPGRARCPPDAPGGGSTERAHGRQLLMSLVAKFAQAALRNTST